MATRKDGKGRVLRKGESYRADGRYSYTFTDPLGQRKTIYSKNLVKLREREDKLVRDQLDGINSYAAGNVTLDKLFDRFMATKTKLRGTTRAAYLYSWSHYVRGTFGKRRVGDVKFSDILYFYSYLLNDMKISYGTVTGVHKLLHAVFQLAVRDDLIRRNPTDGAILEFKSRNNLSKGIRHALAQEHLKAFIGFLADNPFYCNWYPFFTVLVGTGCRIGELIGLTWDDIDFERRIISINHSMSYCGNKKDDMDFKFRVYLPKTEAGIREIPMIQPVYEVLFDEYERQLEEGFCKKKIEGLTRFVFFDENGHPHIPFMINRLIKRIVDVYNKEEKAKAVAENREPLIIPNFSCHVLRHTFASRLCEQETNLKVIQTIMGHSDVSTTMNIYAEVSSSATREALDNLASKLEIF